MNNLEKALKKIHFTQNNGLVFCSEPDKSENIGERYHIEEKALKLEATAVLFRREYDYDGKVINSKPVLYIYNEKDNLSVNSDKHRELHAKIWSMGEIDVYFIVSNTSIDIFNARKPAVIEKRKSGSVALNLESLCLVSEALNEFDDQRFSAMIFGKGIFWDQEDFFDKTLDDRFFRNKLEKENAPAYQLIEYLNTVRKHLNQNSNGLSPDTIDNLLITCILIKFLEEIKDDDGKHTLRTIFKKFGIDSFAAALENGMCLGVLRELAREFNGNIFDNFSDDEKRCIENTNLKLVADFLRAKLDMASNQYFLWEQYSFKHIPVELISSIYESFLPKEKGVVYTPPFLVNTLVDEAMPLEKAERYFSRNQFKVFDPSCGSGVFLVAAYKRMLQWWSVNRYKETRKIEFPQKTDCQKILEDNIFGTDVKGAATLISIFSLTIALLDKLEPKEIWNNLKLNSLRDNIQTRNFFDWATANRSEEKKFDLVIGNPPFNPQTGLKKKDVATEDQLNVFGIKNKDIPNNNIALKFFEGAMYFGKKACMLLPANAILYAKNAQKYRTRIFSKFTIKKIFDFTHSRRVLFENTDVPVCAIFANSDKSTGQKIEHVVVKRLNSVEKKIRLEIDHYDRHQVPHNWVLDDKKAFVWKTNLLGGGRLFQLICRLSLLDNLNSFIEEKRKENQEWIFQDGYKNPVENPGKIIPYIYNRDKVSAIEDGEIISNEKEVRPDFERPRPENLYQLPLLIFHKKVGDFSLHVGIKKEHTDDYLVFSDNFTGIHAPTKDFSNLQNIFDGLKKYADLYLLWMLATSSSAMVAKETAIKKNELESLPFPGNERYLRLSETEEILQKDLLEYYVHLGKAISKNGEETLRKSQPGTT